MCCTTPAVHRFTVITGPLVPLVISSNANQILHAVLSALSAGFGTGNSISLLTLHANIMKQSHHCLAENTLTQ